MSKLTFADDYFEEAPGCEKWNSGLYKALDHSKKSLVVTGGWDSGLFKTVETHKRRLAPDQWDKTLPKPPPHGSVYPHEPSWEPKTFPRRQWPVHEDGWDSGLHKTLPNDTPKRQHVGGWDSGLHKTIANEQPRNRVVRSFADKGVDKSDPAPSPSRRPIRRDSWSLAEKKTVPNSTPLDKSAALHGKTRAVEGTGWDSGLFKTIPNDTESTAARLKASRQAADPWAAGDKTFRDPHAIYRVKSTGQPMNNYEATRPGVLHEQVRRLPCPPCPWCHHRVLV